MSARTKWKTVIDGAEKSHRSEDATYEFLRDWAASADAGAKVSVYVQEAGSERWMTYEHLSVLNGRLVDA
jgi:hypothetical protein